MKKVYEKPMVAIESFILTQSIAVSCGYTPDKFFGHPTHGDALYDGCGWDNGLGGQVYWAVGAIDACNVDTDYDAVVGEVCYNEPAGGAQIFAS